MKAVTALRESGKSTLRAITGMIAMPHARITGYYLYSTTSISSSIYCENEKNKFAQGPVLFSGVKIYIGISVQSYTGIPLNW